MFNICVLRRANVIAETHCDMYVLTADSFQQILRNFPSAGQNIRENLEKKMKSVLYCCCYITSHFTASIIEIITL